MILDYCHNVDGMRRLAEFVGLMMEPANGQPRGQAIGVIGMPGTGATLTIASTAGSPASPSTRSSSARTAIGVAGRRVSRPSSSGGSREGAA